MSDGNRREKRSDSVTENSLRKSIPIKYDLTIYDISFDEFFTTKMILRTN